MVTAFSFWWIVCYYWSSQMRNSREDFFESYIFCSSLSQSSILITPFLSEQVKNSIWNYFPLLGTYSGFHLEEVNSIPTRTSHQEYFVLYRNHPNWLWHQWKDSYTKCFVRLFFRKTKRMELYLLIPSMWVCVCVCIIMYIVIIYEET